MDILYEDNHLLIVNKPAGMLTQGDATGDRSLLDLGKEYLKEKYHKPGAVYLTPAHRLDRPASGAVALARTDKAASRLAEQFRARATVEKIYLAAVESDRLPPSGEMRDALLIGGNKTTVADSVGAKNAALTYEVLAARHGRSLVKIKLLTGYKHQIRAQFAARRAPLTGDFRYAPNGAAQPLDNGRAIALHAWRLTLLHPTKREPLTVIAPPPAWVEAWGKFV
ncbi:MAG: RluA family pseudouridine synthase [Planctomycetota bacterium]|jgi:23S rRNA pseudouridine1911/1915/1917 synthase|nr:RluA family pseudouridine synthase [Planctomycetota bacterium]